MTTLPATLSQTIPAPTPQHALSLSPQELKEHRAAIAFDVEVVLDGYWDRRPPEHIKAGILADWSDELQDWTKEQVLYGLRKWRSENPSKKPNPSHVSAILKRERGRKEAERMRQKAPRSTQDAVEAVESVTAEQRAETQAILAEFAKRKNVA